MPVLKNQRHERFAQELAKGAPAIEAYKKAGYRPDRGAASRLSSKVSVKARVQELLGNAALRTEVTVSRVTENLVRIADKAEKIGESNGLSVARSAWMDAAKINGLVKEKHEHSGLYDFSKLDDDEFAEFQRLALKASVSGGYRSGEEKTPN